MLGFLWPFDETSGGDDVTTISPLFRYSNYAEAVLWMAIAAVVIVRARRRGGVTRLHGVLAVALVLFGVSDLIETTTGAWWRPWWLLVWKGSCLLAFPGVFIVSRKNCGSGAVVGSAPADGLSPSETKPVR